MSVMQVEFIVPEEIEAGIEMGLYQITSGVVRYASGPLRGQIVMHLKTANEKITDKAVNKAVEKMALSQGHSRSYRLGLQMIDLIKANKEIAIGVGAGIVVAGLGYGIYKRVKKREFEVISQFRSASEQYLDEVKNAMLRQETVDTLLSAIDDLVNLKRFGKYLKQLSNDEIILLANQIDSYTLRFASANGMHLTEQEHDKGQNAIIRLQINFEAQKRVFEEAA